MGIYGWLSKARVEPPHGRDGNNVSRASSQSLTETLFRHSRVTYLRWKFMISRLPSSRLRPRLYHGPSLATWRKIAFLKRGKQNIGPVTIRFTLGRWDLRHLTLTSVCLYLWNFITLAFGCCEPRVPDLTGLSLRVCGPLLVSMVRINALPSFFAILFLFSLLVKASTHLERSELSSPPLEKRLTVGSGEPYWYANIRHQGQAPYGSDAQYTIFRNVMDYGAKGDGVSNDTDALNRAINDGTRCGLGCESQSTKPAIIYFPPGTYMISRPLIMFYYTQIVGDANNLPTIKPLPDFYGIALLDSDPYLAYGFSWWQNQNNFWRQVRNLIIDISALPAGNQFSCIHWQVAQGTSLQNIVFVMASGVSNNQHIVSHPGSESKSLTDWNAKRVSSWTTVLADSWKTLYSTAVVLLSTLAISSGLLVT